MSRDGTIVWSRYEKQGSKRARKGERVMGENSWLRYGGQGSKRAKGRQDENGWYDCISHPAATAATKIMMCLWYPSLAHLVVVDPLTERLNLV